MSTSAEESGALAGYTRVLIGILGGLAAAMTKYIGQDHAMIFPGDGAFDANRAFVALAGYCVLMVILGFIGALCAWASSDETNRLKLLAIAVAAPSMITTFLGGEVDRDQDAWLLTSPIISVSTFISPAQAQEIDPNPLTKQYEKPGLWDYVSSGWGFVSRTKEPPAWVIVGSFADKSSAERYASEIAAEDPGLAPYIGFKTNGVYPVLVGGITNRTDAPKILERANQIEAVRNADAFVSSGW